MARIIEAFDARYAQEMDVDDEEIAKRKAFLEFGEEDEEILTSLNDVARSYATPVIEDLYKHFLSFEETRAFFSEQKMLEHVKRMQLEYFLRLTQGNYDAEYVANRLKIGAVHERVQLAPKWYLGAYAFYMRSVARQLSRRTRTIRREPFRSSSP